MPNGNTLICSGKTARFLEVDPNDEMVWEYISPFPSTVFRCSRFSAEYPGLVGRDLTPGAQLEQYVLTISGTGHSPAEPTSSDTVTVTTMVGASIAPQSVTLVINTGGGDSFLPMNLVSSGAEEFSYQATILPMQKNSIVTYYLAFEIDLDSTMYDPPIAPSVLYRFSVSPSESYVCGDANADALVNVGDAVFMINFIFKNGATPVPYEAGDVNCDDSPNVGDAVYLINYIFKGGPIPCETCQ